MEYEKYIKKKMKEYANEGSVKILTETNMKIDENSWTKIKVKGWNHDKNVKEEGWQEVTN